MNPIYVSGTPGRRAELARLDQMHADIVAALQRPPMEPPWMVVGLSMAWGAVLFAAGGVFMRTLGS